VPEQLAQPVPLEFKVHKDFPDCLEDREQLAQLALLV
jgi:hypothetical protein